VAVIAFATIVAAGAAAPARAQHHGSHPADPQSADPHASHKAMMHRGGSDADAVEIEGGLDIPDVPVLTQDGEARSFYTDLVEGRTVAMNFVFTTCTTICPPMGANFGRLQKELGERLGREVHLISVSVDPKTDTPERLKAWSEKFGARPGWTLVTGDQQAMERLLKALEVFTADIRDHAPVVLIGDDAAGEWTRAYGLAGPKTLVEIVDRVSRHAGASPATAAPAGGAQ
jgi:protein SCO1/2